MCIGSSKAADAADSNCSLLIVRQSITEVLVDLKFDWDSGIPPVAPPSIAAMTQSSSVPENLLVLLCSGAVVVGTEAHATRARAGLSRALVLRAGLCEGGSTCVSRYFFVQVVI